MRNKHFLTMLYMGLLVFLTACNADKKQMLVNTWHMHHDEMILELRADGSYSVEQQSNKETGKWDLSADGKTIKFKQRTEGEEKAMDIKELDENKLVLNNDGDEMIFTSTPETIESE